MVIKFLRNSRNLFIIGALLAVMAFVLAFFALTRTTQSIAANASGPAAAPTPVAVPVLVATKDISIGASIVDPTLARSLYFTETLRTIPANQAALGIVPGLAGLNALLAVAPRHLATNLSKGDLVLASELITNTAPGTVDYSPLLYTGEVVEQITVLPANADGGGIQPSDHVDMILTHKFDLTKSKALSHAFYTPTGQISANTDNYTIVGNLAESQVVLQNLRVLNVIGNMYMVAMTHQDAVLLKWIKDYNDPIELVVRADADTTGTKKAGPPLFTTNPVLPDYLLKAIDQQAKHKSGMITPFVLP